MFSENITLQDKEIANIPRTARNVIKFRGIDQGYQRVRVILAVFQSPGFPNRRDLADFFPFSLSKGTWVHVAHPISLGNVSHLSRHDER